MIYNVLKRYWYFVKQASNSSRYTRANFQLKTQCKFRGIIDTIAHVRVKLTHRGIYVILRGAVNPKANKKLAHPTAPLPG